MIKWSRIKRITSLVLCLLMVFSLLPVSSLADEASSPTPADPVATPHQEATPAPEVEHTASTQDTTPVPALDAEYPSPSPALSPAPETTAPEAQAYLVNFVIDGDTKWDLQQTVAEGETAKAPGIPAVPEGEAYVGQIFLYWYARANEAYDFNTPVTANLTLTAKFGSVSEATKTEDTPVVVNEEILFAAFSMAGGILPESTPLWTYQFVVDGVTVDSKIVANGDTLDAPQVPAAPDGMKFSGWYTNSGTLFEGFGTQNVTVNGTTTLTAKFEPAYYVFFYNRSGAVIETRVPDAAGVVSTTNIASLELGGSEALLGWSLTPGGTAAVGGTVTVSGANIRLYPIIGEVIWVSFDSTGGTYVPPMHIAPGTALTQAAVNAHVLASTGLGVITKEGYTFSNWSGVAFGSVPAANVTLSANWTPNNNTPYKLVYWIENADDSDFTFEKTVNKTGISGATITPSTAETATNNLNSAYAAYFNIGTYTPGQTVNGDGTTIVNLYFARKTYTLAFKSGTNTIYSQSCKYDQNVSDVWNVPAIATLSAAGNVWKSSITGSYYTFLEKMPGSNLTLTATSWSGSKYTWYYCLETLDGTAATAPAGSTTVANGGITYYITKTVSIKANGISLTYDEDYFPITGFYQRDSVVPSFSNVGGEYFASLYYRRSSYNLTFINGSASQTVSGIRFGAPIEGQYYEPTRPVGVSAAFTFDGWYTTQAGYEGSKFDWTGKTMPPKNVVLYAKWVAPTFSSVASLNAYGSTGTGTIDLGSIPYGGTISASALANAQAAVSANKPHPNDLFGGWLIERNGSLVVFNPSMQIFEDVVLYPVWLNGLSYRVTYALGEASGTEPVDSEAYASGSQAQVKALDPAAVTPPTDKVFIGWRSGVDLKIYYPSSAITITQNTTLTAVWVYPAVNVTITYDGNGGMTSGGMGSFTGGTLNNTHHTVQGNAFVYEGKLFKGWNTKSDGTGTGYQPGDSVLLGTSVVNAPGTLYAIWEDQTFIVEVSGDPASGLSAANGAGSYVYHTNAMVTWTIAPGYELVDVSDNGVILSAASYAGGSYAINSISDDHAVVVYTKLKNLLLTYNGNGGMVGGNGSYSSTKTM
ncbi:MAG TPA: InlB B-repeat-containing protein, partial [Clostridia bacterium]|nr:InlB B-repeat-containing protein [Clostridia bacterium]